MRTKKQVAWGTCIGKHDIHLAIELNAVFKAHGLESWGDFERARGRVGLVIKGNEATTAIALFLEKHPDFTFAYENPRQGETRFLYFHQSI